VSWRFESIINLTRVKTRQHDTRRPGGHHDWQQFTMWPKSWVGSYLALAPSSTCMPRRTHCGWPEHYPIIHLWSEVRYRPTHRHMKLPSLGISYVSYAPVHFKCLFNRAQLMWAFIDTGGGYHLGAPNIRLDHSSSFPSNILHFPLIARPVSNYANHSIILLNHIGPPLIERALSRVDSNHSSSTDSLHK
jgi:hypothetical protein